MTPSDTAGRRPEPGPEGHEDDPTGIRALLAALPDPGPMPADLVERIEARLAVEQAHLARGASAGLAARSDSVIDLAAERSHRRPGRTVAMLGAAAAGLLVATVAIGELAGVGPADGPVFDSAAQVPARSAAGGAESGGDAGGGAGGGGDSAGGEDLQEADQAQGQADGSADDEAAADAGSAPEEETLLEELSGEVLIVSALGAVGPDDYRQRIVDQAQEQRSATVPSGSLTTAAARSCWQQADPSRAWPVMRAAEAEMDGQRVVVLLGTQAAGTDAGEALVLPWSCTTGRAVEILDAQAWPAP